VGGIPEILPDSMMTLSEPNVRDLMKNLELSIQKFESGNILDPMEMHEKVKSMYNWHDVAQRTEVVYDRVVQTQSPTDLKSKLLRFKRCGYLGFYFIALVIVCDYLLIRLLNFLNPASKIDKADDCSRYRDLKNKQL